MSHEQRLLDQFADHVSDVHPEWELDEDLFRAKGHRVLSPVEPCGQCGHKVWLMLPAGKGRPVWLVLAGIKGADTLFPVGTTKRHACGDGDSWSVEAALFVDEALRTWAVA